MKWEVGDILGLLCLSARAEEEESGNKEEAKAQKNDKRDEEVHHRGSDGRVPVGHVGARVVADDESREYSHCVE